MNRACVEKALELLKSLGDDQEETELLLPDIIAELEEVLDDKNMQGNPTQAISLLNQSSEYDNPVDSIDFHISHNERGIYIRPEGYGDKCSQDGQGIPIMIEFYDGEPRVIIWDDINHEDSSHTISLRQADEKLREDD